MENSKLLELYTVMQRIRLVERRIEAEYQFDEIKTPIHLSIGQEAIAAGVCANLSRGDYLFCTHRSHAQYLAKGGDLRKMIAELYLRKTGCSMGRGGSMHLVDTEVGMMGSSAIVGGDLPLGTGAGLASKLRGDGKITAVFFGDGAVDEGNFHECLNFAALKRLPVLYICENNLYAINSRVDARHAGDGIFRWAQGYNIPSRQIDGNDVCAVEQVSHEAAAHCRSGKGPYFIECLTYRQKGHIGTVDDVGPGFRSREEYEYWLAKDPIPWYRAYLVKTGVLDDARDEEILSAIGREVEDAFAFAKSSPKPAPEELLEFVYADQAHGKQVP